MDGWVGSLRNEATGYESHSSVGDLRWDAAQPSARVALCVYYTCQFSSALEFLGSALESGHIGGHAESYCAIES